MPWIARSLVGKKEGLYTAESLHPHGERSTKRTYCIELNYLFFLFVFLKYLSPLT